MEDLDTMTARITVRNDGSLRIEGDFELIDAAGKSFDLGGRTAISLCRCGQSSDKPFCDATHSKIGFHSECPARALPPKI